MSRESRLVRLGLIHLKDKPEELQRCLEEMLIEIEAEKTRLRTSTSQTPSSGSERSVPQPDSPRDE
jgi:hypothetical protein